ncbi:hypothetical protein, partial [uncultured Sphingomonas sp.]|uniref:hypothetical protein n=1 Tax=uncultured Sphingomonas sp. TaxID=158754 RepID=UPI0035CB128F
SSHPDRRSLLIQIVALHPGLISPSSTYATLSSTPRMAAANMKYLMKPSFSFAFDHADPTFAIAVPRSLGLQNATTTPVATSGRTANPATNPSPENSPLVHEPSAIEAPLYK